MENIITVVEKKAIDGILWVAEHPAQTLKFIGLTAWTVFTYKRGYQSGRAVGFTDAICALADPKLASAKKPNNMQVKKWTK